MKNISSKRAKALAITKSVKDAVFARDGYCVWCGSPEGQPNAHYISRAHGGLGIEQNILTLCQKCHHEFDFSNRDQREYMKRHFRYHFNSKYPDWDESNLIYKKD